MKAENKIENVKVSYGKIWDENGYTYRKGLRMKEKTAYSLLGMIRAAAAMEEDESYKKLLLSSPTRRLKNAIFLNLTQGDFIVEKLIKCADVKIDAKRARTQANTYLVINE